METSQGNVYWVTLNNPDGSPSGNPHPHVVVQEDDLNHSTIPTVVICAISTNLHRVNLPGNILLDKGEANLPKQSIVIVSRVSTINKSDLGEYVGRLSRQRVDQILAGMRFLQTLSER